MNLKSSVEDDLGRAATSGNCRINGHAERLTHGAIVLRGSAQGIVAQMQISDFFGRPYDPTLETITGNDYDFSVFKLSPAAATARDQNLSLFAKRSQTLISARARLTQPALVEQVITSSTTIDFSKGTLLRIVPTGPTSILLPFVVKDFVGLRSFVRIVNPNEHAVTFAGPFGTTVGGDLLLEVTTSSNFSLIGSQYPSPGDWSLWN